MRRHSQAVAAGQVSRTYRLQPMHLSESAAHNTWQRCVQINAHMTACDSNRELQQPMSSYCIQVENLHTCQRFVTCLNRTSCCATGRCSGWCPAAGIGAATTSPSSAARRRCPSWRPPCTCCRTAASCSLARYPLLHYCCTIALAGRSQLLAVLLVLEPTTFRRVHYRCLCTELRFRLQL